MHCHSHDLENGHDDTLDHCHGHDHGHDHGQDHANDQGNDHKLNFYSDRYIILVLAILIKFSLLSRKFFSTLLQKVTLSKIVVFF